MFLTYLKDMKSLKVELAISIAGTIGRTCILKHIPVGGKSYINRKCSKDSCKA